MQQPKKNFRWRSVLRWTIWVIVVQLVLINISAALHADKLSRFYTDPALRDAAPPRNILSRTWRLFAGQRFPKSIQGEAPYYPHDTVMLRTGSGLKIEAWYAAADSNAKGTVILFHGLTMNKSRVLAEANEFRYDGYHVMLVDFRAHGNSEGKVTTIGYREAEDVKLAYDYVAAKGEKTIFIWGFSMGAVAAMKATVDYQLKPAGLILEMPFLSLQSHLRARARTSGFRGFAEKPFAFFTTFWMGAERGFNGYGFRVDGLARQISCPVLLQWGDKDRLTLRSETDKIFQALPGPDKVLAVYTQADHQSLLQNDPDLWRKETGAFLSAHRH